ncbi:MAG TPA: AmmeMemoRadiSam system protein A [Methylococcaceae bacterium]|nr:AmmeMemoRadiSam system protein A [Methylococcaceae bacterium]
MSSAETPVYAAEERRQLLAVARNSIEHGLRHRAPLPVNVAEFPAKLCEKGACFVTLYKAGRLRGCIGTLQACRHLVEDVAHNAFAAAFSDPRFPPVGAAETVHLDLHISVLTPATEMHFDSEEDLLRQLVPGEDGLILQEGARRGTFLPSVWEQLPEKREFLQHLKLKAGLPVVYWSETLRVFRYRTEQFGA